MHFNYFTGYSLFANRDLIIFFISIIINSALLNKCFPNTLPLLFKACSVPHSLLFYDFL